MREHPFKDEKIRELLNLMIQVFALKEITRDNQLIYESGFFSKGAATLLNESYNSVLRTLRPHLIPLIESGMLEREDSWNLSVIGNKYGDIYEAQLEVAKNSRLNTGNPPPYFETLMKPLMKGGHAKL